MSSSDKLKITDLEFDSIKSNLIEYLKGQDKFQDYDFAGSGMSIILDLLAYNTHYMGYYANMLGNEMFLDSSSLRESVVSHAKHLNVHPFSKKASRAKLDITINPVEKPTSLTIGKNTKFSSSINGTDYTYTTNINVTVKRNLQDTYIFSGLEIIEGTILNKSYVVNSADTTQRFIIPNADVDTSTLNVVVQKSTTDSDVSTYTDGNSLDITTINGKDKVFYLQEVEDKKYEITFGDGTVGKQLTDGNVIFIEYIITSGSDGNFAKDFTAIGQVAGTSSSDYVLTTSQIATGGADIQSLSSLQYQAPKLYQAQGRATTKYDYQAIILQQRPDVESITVYGGEDADPVQYGRVFIAMKITGTNLLSISAKDSIKQNILKKVNVVTVEPVIIDPVFFYIILESTVNYDPVSILTDEDTLKANISQKIKNHLINNLEKFNQKFRYSQLVQDIDNVSSTIRNNKTNLKYQQRIRSAVSDSPQTYILNFSNKLEKGSVSSTSFTGSDGNTYSLQDDLSGYINAVRTSDGKVISPLEFLAQPDGTVNQGTINYDTGKITLDSLILISITDGSDSVRINVTPEINNSDITPKREQILTYDDTDASSITINMIAETII
tara:strand:+ start:1046 stop:2875 length:1830 start_codon:yes stop_codon:yes gene_type:complete